jgi:hypothetical protein
MKQAKYFSIAVLILSALFVFSSCAYDTDDMVGDECPEPSEVPGEYVFCVCAYFVGDDEKAIVKDGTTPVGIYETGTQITVEAVPQLEYTHFIGWLLKKNGYAEPISEENPYTFTLVEDTYIFAEYYYDYGDVNN